MSQIRAELKHDSDRCQYAAADTLAEIGDTSEEVRYVLFEALSDSHKWVRVSALRALASLCPEDARLSTAMNHALQDPEDVVRKAAATEQQKLGLR